MYKSTLSNTILKMWDIARVIYKDYIPTHRVFYITQKNDNTISIVGSERFFIVSYEKTYHTIRYDKIYNK